LNIFFDNPNANIGKKLEGERLFEATNKISDHFPYELDKKYIHIMVELPGYHLTLIGCTKKNELVPTDKIIFKEGPLDLEGEIVRTNVGIRIKFVYKSEILMLDSFTKFIEQVKKIQNLSSNKETKPYIWSKNIMENLMIYLHASDEKLSWFDFRERVLSQRKIHQDLK
ncbi:16682_t:CDS:2, partial [Racocetra persica]